MSKGMSAGKIVLLVVGIGGGLIILSCAGVIGLGWFGLDMIAKQSMAALNENDVVKQRVGRITELEIDWLASGEVEGDDVLVFQFVGEKSSGSVTAELVTVDADTEEVVAGEIVLDSGETYNLFPEETGERRTTAPE